MITRQRVSVGYHHGEVMAKNIFSLAFLTACLLVITGQAQAAGSGIEKAAVDRLRTSMSYLGGLKTFSLETHSTIEVVLHSGQKIQFDNSINAEVQRPDKFHAIRLGDLLDQEFFYDGKSLTLVDENAGYHATVEAPDTLEGMLDFARDSLDIVAPAGDFIHANAFEILMEGVTSAFVVGSSFVEGEVCDHLAFSAPDTDWQIWIQQGEMPLPRRIVITSRDVINAPQYTVHIHDWDLKPDLSATKFRFDEHQDTTAIEFITLGADGN